MGQKRRKTKEGARFGKWAECGLGGFWPSGTGRTRKRSTAEKDEGPSWERKFVRCKFVLSFPEKMTVNEEMGGVALPRN